MALCGSGVNAQKHWQNDARVGLRCPEDANRICQSTWGRMLLVGRIRPNPTKYWDELASVAIGNPGSGLNNLYAGECM